MFYMGQIVCQFPLETIRKMERHYQDSLRSTPQGAIFSAQTPDAVITAYKSGKVLFQGRHPEAEIEKWPQGESKTTEKHERNEPSPFTPKNSLYLSSHIGSDEAGTGDYFGPITVSAVYMNEANINLLQEIGIKDSKTLSDDKISQLALKLMEEEIPYSLLVLPNEKYNRLQRQGWSQGKMKAMLHHHAIKKLKKKIGNQRYDGIVIDQFCTPQVFERYIHSEDERLLEHTYFVTKAESYSLAVAASSIIARAKFVEEMERLSKEVGIPLPKGASEKVDRAIAEIIRNKGKETLHYCGKIHFANTEKANKYL